MNRKLCAKCQDPSKKSISSSGLCRYCCTVKINTQALLKIEKEFKAAGPYNKRLFKLYLEKIRSGYVKNSELPVAKRFSRALIQTALSPFTSWEDAYSLSKKLKIHHAGHPTQGCPVIRVARILEQRGELNNRKKELIVSRRNVLLAFDLGTREIIELYLQEISKKHKTKSATLKVALHIKQFYLFTKKENLFAVTPEIATAYLDSLVEKSVAEIQDSRVILERFYLWSVEHKKITLNPFGGIIPKHLIRQCRGCRKIKTLRLHETLCAECYLNLRYGGMLSHLILNYKAPSPYNQHLFDLYVKYIRRYRIRGKHIRATKTLSRFLESKALPAILSWTSIVRLSEELKEQQNRPIRGGCPIVKIGRMLQELSILPIRETDQEIFLEYMLSKLPNDVELIFRRYIRTLKNNRRSTAGTFGITRIIYEFYSWLKNNEPEVGLFTASEITARKFISSLPDMDRHCVRRRSMDRFYRWCKREKLTLLNPFEKFPSHHISKSLCILSDHQIKKIAAFIKNPKSDPEYALMLALVLYWGLTVRELAMSTIDIRAKQIQINLHRNELSYKNKNYRRDQVLKLPLEPKWLAALQKKYISFWSQFFEKTKKDFPLQPLFLNKQGRNNRPLRSLAIRKRFYRATLAATGIKIPPNVLRRTSGHIHLNHNDASMLMRFGWSQDYCHDFICKPRKFFTP
jgi:site-specific recombinase XerD